MIGRSEYSYGERNQTRLGTVGWAVLAATAATIDFTFEESLTHAFQRGLDDRRYRPLLLAGMGITALHLTGNLPRPADPFYLIQDTAQFVHRTLTK